MKGFLGSATAFVGLLASVGVAAPPLLVAQTTRQRVPDDVPRLMVINFRAAEKGVGSQAAEAVRQRVQSDLSLKNIVVIPKATMCANLEASGFPCDSVPDPITSKLLATQLRADEYLDGTVSKGGDGTYRLEARMVLTRDNNMAQPLPEATGKKVGELAEQVSKSLQAARKQLADERKCELAVSGGNAQEAVQDARAAIAAYPNSTIARVCLANAYLKLTMPADSIISVAGKVVELDPHSKPALRLLGDAYAQAGNVDKAVAAWTNLIAADPKNVGLVTDVINKIAQSGRADIAKPIIVKAVDENPGDPDLVHLKWLILLATKDYAGATETGEEMVKVDTAAADTTFFYRQAAAYAAANQPQKAFETTSKAVAKFKNNAGLWSLHAQTARLAGQTQIAADAARTAVKLDPKAEHGWLRLAQAQIELAQPDSAIASLKQAVAAGEDKATVGQFLLVLGNKAYKYADSTKRREDYQRAVSLLASADSVAPSALGKFLLGYSAFKVGDLAVRENQTAKRCDLVQLAQQNFLIAQINLPQGAAANADTKTASLQLLNALGQYSPVVDAMNKRYCK